MSTGDWGGKAFLAGGLGAAVAEVSYLTLGGGLGVMGTSSAGLGNAGGFAGTYALNAGSNSALHSDQIYNASKNGDGWNGVWLSGGYDLAAGLQIGLTSEWSEGAIDKVLTLQERGVVNDILGGTLSDALGGALNSGLNSYLEFYNPSDNSWKVNWGVVLTESWIGGVANGGSKIIGNGFDYLSLKRGAEGSMIMAKNFATTYGNVGISNYAHNKNITLDFNSTYPSHQVHLATANTKL